MIKTLPKREFDKFFSILEPYFKHIRKHPDSLISRFFGLYKVKWQDAKGKSICRYLVIMNNIFKEFNVGIRFDLKGSFTGRNLIKEDQKFENWEADHGKTALKDNDFRAHYQSIVNLDESPEMMELMGQNRQFREIMSSDCDFLASCQIIDYSLLLGEIIPQQNQS